MTELPKFRVPARVDRYARAAAKRLQRQGASLAADILADAEIEVVEGEEYDNWNGGIYGHAVVLAIPDELFDQIGLDLESIQSQIHDEFRTVISEPAEFISRVSIEICDDCRLGVAGSRGVTNAFQPLTTSDDLQRIWGKSKFNLFISHKASRKRETVEVREKLSEYGVSGFVAHENIEPDESWREEILRALFSADALVALLSDDFKEGDWTGQEIGVAVGRGIPVYCVRLGIDPYGLIGYKQGIPGSGWENPSAIGKSIYETLAKKLPDQNRLWAAAVDVYRESGSWAESAQVAKGILAKFNTLTPSQIDMVREAFASNSQSYGSFAGCKALIILLNKWTGENWIVKDGHLAQQEESAFPSDVPDF